MISQILGYLRDLLFLAHDMRENKASIKKLEEEVSLLIKTVEKLSYEMEHLREVERLEREKLILQLQNALARFELRLPPPR